VEGELADRNPHATDAEVAEAENALVVGDYDQANLGLGDLGVGGMGIPIGKLSLYTAAAGIQPSWALPVSLDVGTDNSELLADPNYLGRRTPRLRGAEYDAFVESFVNGVQAAFPGCVIQWEDFKQQNAIRILERYRNNVPSFNDDIQGTGAVALAGVIAAIVAGGGSGTGKIEDQRILFYGAGAATLGIARLMRHTLSAAGLQGTALDTAIIALDSKGVVHEGRAELGDGKSELALSEPAVAALGLGQLLNAGLTEVIQQVKPTILIGTSGQAGAFTEPVVRAMAAAAAAPLVWPLSNPTSCAEATPSDIFAWSDGRAVVATGSPFDPVVVNGTARTISQANNVYIFPGVGLAAIAGRLKSIPDEAFIVAATTLAALTARSAPAGGALYPPLADLRSMSRAIAIAVIEAGAAAGWASAADGARAAELVDGAMWSPNYRAYVPA
ncbi:MAG: oxaloacetate-decarboxylating malate dehydrogenase, partial [bacterium]|nr:oxaloacetate-decarboxylating malate dehydrogenase [Candidatus Aquidulcis sp.]